jgi:lipoate---protein ligase
LRNLEPVKGTSINCLVLEGVPIWEQLLIEERLLKCDQHNWCLINKGSPCAVVMGISGKEKELLFLDKLSSHKVPLFKRFSGGGTVVVDEETLFVTFISNQDSFSFPSFPEKIMKWTQVFWKDVFKELPFSLRDNDYLLGEKKCGGNAQYITKNRWLHHTSFLWNFDPKKMALLKIPNKQPDYRNQRSHLDFLTTLKEYGPIDQWIQKIKETLRVQFSQVHQLPPSHLSNIPKLDHYRTKRIYPKE